MPLFWIIASITITIGVVIFLAIRYEQKRQERIRLTAEELGLTFLPKPEAGFSAPFGRLPVFQLGHSRKFANCMTGDSGEVRISIFDYSYTTGSGKQQHTRRMTVVALQSPALRLPQFTLRPENLLDKLGGMLGFQDLDFDDDPEFSAAFVLKGTDEQAVRGVFNSGLRARFVRSPGTYVEAQGNLFISYRAQRARPEEYPELLKQAYETFGLLVDEQPHAGNNETTTNAG